MTVAEEIQTPMTFYMRYLPMYIESYLMDHAYKRNSAMFKKRKHNDLKLEIT